jgi:antitoxin component YwqK of YwqJK toxin-antitoxin module
MKYFLLPFLLVAFSTSSFSQSKKEQIEILNARVDSVKQILSSERKTSEEKSSKISELNTKIIDLDGKILNLEKEKTNLNNSISKLTGEITSLNTSVNQLKNDLNSTKTSLDNTTNSKNQEIAILNLQIKTKSDSLKLVQNELNKLKPAPKQTNTNQNTNSAKRVELKDITQIQDGDLYYYVLKTPLETTGNKEKVNGIVFSNYNNGKTMEEYTYKEGNLYGPFKVYFPNGNIRSEGNLYGWNHEGIYKEYHVNGRLKRKTDYRNGTAWEDRCYDENGDEIKPCLKD